MKFPEYDQHDGLGLAELVERGEVSAGELLEACIERIEARNPQVNAVVHTSFTRARQQLADGAIPDGPFHGVPFVLKDLHGEDGGQPCTSSCRMLANWRAPQDCELVRRYKKAGVVIVGRTNTPEFGIYATTEPELRGPSRNPWDLRHTTGGSSGGTGAAVAARIVPLGHGNDGGGSIRIPSAHCGLFGLKPTRGRIPAGPYRAQSWGGLSIDHVLTRSVRDSAAMLDATHGADPGAPYTAPAPARPFLSEVGADPGKLRIAYTEEPLFGDTTDPDCVQAVRDAAQLARELGHEVEVARPAFDRTELVRAYLFLVAAGVSTGVREAGHLIGRTPRREDFELATWMFKVLGDSVTAAEYVTYHEIALGSHRTLARFFDDWDVFLTPTAARPPVQLGEFALNPAERAFARFLDSPASAPLRSQKARGVMMRVIDEMARGPLSATPNTMLFNMTGQPAMSTPLFWNDQGLPIGTQWVGRFGDEATLLRLAAQLEAARPWAARMPPNLR